MMNTHCPKSRSNNRLRVHIDQFIALIPLGGTFKTQSLARELQKTHKSLRMSPQRASCLIRDRDDVQWTGDGTWMRVHQTKERADPVYPARSGDVLLLRTSRYSVEAEIAERFVQKTDPRDAGRR